MQTLRKKNSPCKFKNDPTRFLGEGVSFKAKLIGILEVSEARGDRMCQAALADLKMAIRAAGEHKQRIAVQVSIDGLRLRDEKTGDCLYHHPVHKISFIAQDMSDSRAFGYIFGSPDTGHRFFGIKTDKAASQVVIAMRDLFQVVFELKKKEIEMAKQHIEQNAINAIKFHTAGGIFVESAPDTKGAAGTESSFHRIRTTNCEVDKTADRKNETQSGVIADLLDLQFELNSLQQGIHQMDKITPENPVPSTDDLFETDPFGDSFANMKLQDTVRPILPPPPSSTKRGHLERQHTVPVPPASTTSSPATTLVSKTPPPQSTIHWFDKEAENLFNDNEMTNLSKNSTAKKDQEDSSAETTPRNTQTKSPQIDVFTELDPLGTGLIKPYVDKKDFFQHLKNPPKKVLKDLVSTNFSDSFPTNFNITTSTDCTESTKTNEMSSKDSEDSNFANFDRFDENEASQSTPPRNDSPPKKETTPRSIHHQPLSVSLPPEETTKGTNTASAGSSILRSMDRDSTESTQGLVKLPSPKKYLQSVRKRDFDIDLPAGKAQSVESNKQFPVDFSMTNESPASPLRSCSSDANSRLSSSSAELDLVPEPPPRGAGSILINPPPLPPKKQGARGGAKPPPRPPHTEGHFQYDFPQRGTSPSPTRIVRDKNKSPPTDTKSHQFDDNFSPPPQISGRSSLMATTASFEDSFSTMISSTTSLSSVPFTDDNAIPIMDSKKTKPSLDITLSQLTSSWTNLDELASSLSMTVQQLTSLTLTQLTQCLASLSTKEAVNVGNVEETIVSPTTTSTTMKEQTVPKPAISSLASKPFETIIGSNSTSFVCSEFFKTNYESETKEDPTYDKYAVFRELLEMERMEQKETNETVEEAIEKEEALNESEQVSDEVKIQSEVLTSESTSNSIVSLVNLTVKLPMKNENILKEGSVVKLDETMANSLANLTAEKEESIEVEDKEVEKENDMMADADVTSDSSTVQQTEIDIEDDTEKTQTNMEVEERAENSERGSDANGTLSDKIGSDILNDETNGSSVAERSSTEVKSSISTSSDRYAALREIIGEPEPVPIKKDDEEMISSARASPVVQSQQQIQQSKSLAEVELLNLFSDNLPPPSSPNISIKKDSEDLTAVAMDIFEEIKMLNTGMHRAKETKPLASSSGFEDMFCPFAETARSDKDDNKEDSNWAKFDTGIFGSSDKSSCEGQRSIGGTSPWSPDGKDFHREIPFKGSGGYRHSGDSDNEWKDEEESEESNGRIRGDGRYWASSRHPRFDAPGFEDRSFYEDADKRDRSFRDRMGRKSRGAPWAKSGGVHRPRDPSPWHEEGQWEDEGPRRYPHRKVQPYKDDEDQYEAHWKCRPKPPPPQRCNWSHDVHGSYYDDERKRKLMLWNEEDRFDSSQESMGYDEEDRWSRRRYERRRWEEDNRFWGRRGPSDADYPMREPYYYYRDSRDRPHDYPSWDEEYGPERPGDDSPRYNPTGRKRHWPKRPNSANDGRNNDMVYADPRKFGASRSECSDNDSDPYLRTSQRSRSRESYWGSDQEYDSWVERPYWSEGPDSKSETMHRKRIARHKTRQAQKTQSPFEDDFAQSVEQHMEATGPSGALESLTPVDTRVRLDTTDQKREPPPASPLSGIRGPKDHLKRDIPIREYNKRSSYFEDDLTPTASASSDASDRQRLSSELKATPEELPCDAKDPQQPIDGFVSEDSGRDSFFNGDLRFDDDAFVFKSELDDNVPDHRATLPLKNSRQGKYGPGNNNNNNKTARGDQYIRKSESVNIFARESDPFDGDDFFN